ncbi:Crp/Fnr family transcriptional regulator [Kineosporia sp. NBRC 101677]|nr:Crp/Fnr family transcriptional regulator [Kineosporia rhizophila]GLY16326.1 Crp/Fnr family transcriptional regulator [Kineosporia sp. NBRC 101677]
MGIVNLLPTGVWQSLLRKGRASRYSQGQVLMRQGERGTHVLLLTSGLVKVSRVEPDGRQLLLAVRGPGEALGEMSAWDDSHRSATVEAIAPCIAYVLSAAQFRRAVHELDASDVLFRHVLQRLREGEDIRAELVGPSAMQRVVNVLLRLAHSVAPELSSTVTLGLGQEDMARAAGLSRSAFTAELAALRRCGLVSTSRQRVVLHDLAKLRALAEETRPAT